jgi:hypothetical protein
MGHKTFLVKLKLHGSEEFQVEAARMEVQDEHLVFLNSSGTALQSSSAPLMPAMQMTEKPPLAKTSTAVTMR